jgi:hypothetical protein
VDAIAFWLMSVLAPDLGTLGCRVIEMSDLGVTGGLGFTAFPGFAADGSDFWAISGCWGACVPLAGCRAVGLAFVVGRDFVSDFVSGGLVFLAVWEWIFLRTTFGAAALSAGGSQPSNTLKKPIKQTKLQMMMRCFFIMVKLILCMDVKTGIRYQFIFFSSSS